MKFSSTWGLDGLNPADGNSDDCQSGQSNIQDQLKTAKIAKNWFILNRNLLIIT